MAIVSPDNDDRVGLLVARGFALAFLLLWILGIPTLIWMNEGWGAGFVVLLLSLAIWLPRWLRIWKMSGDPGHPGWIHSDNFGNSGDRTHSRE